MTEHTIYVRTWEEAHKYLDLVVKLPVYIKHCYNMDGNGYLVKTEQNMIVIIVHD